MSVPDSDPAPEATPPRRDDPTGADPRPLLSVGVFVVGVGLVLAPLLLDSVAGARLRSSLLVELRTDAAGSHPQLTGAAEEAAAFYSARDSVAFTLARPMTVAEFLSIYHLGGNPGVRAALRQQLGAAGDGDVIPGGSNLRIPLTPSPESP